MDLAVSFNGELASTISDDKTVKVFDVVNFGTCFFFFYINFASTAFMGIFL